MVSISQILQSVLWINVLNILKREDKTDDIRIFWDSP